MASDLVSPNARATSTYSLAAAAIAASVGSKREMKVPKRPRVSTIAADSSSRKARATVFAATPSWPAKSRTVGSRLPGGNAPVRTPSMTWVRSWPNNGLPAFPPTRSKSRNSTHPVCRTQGYLCGMRVTVLSGAGISAESGVPTFRDDKNGLWAKFDPYELSSVQGWQRNPERVWGWYLWRHYLVGTVEPNPGHRAVAAWQDHAEVSVVTQNVDDLHERAGSSPVHHLHGSLFDFRCATCGLPYTGELPEMAEPALEVEPPTCTCGGLIRPDIVWFGEPLPEEPWHHAVEATTGADLLVVVGTSAIVYPAASLPELALARGTAVIEVNPEPTPLSDNATITVRETASKALPTLLQRLPALLN